MRCMGGRQQGEGCKEREGLGQEGSCGLAGILQGAGVCVC